MLSLSLCLLQTKCFFNHKDITIYTVQKSIEQCNCSYN